MASAWNEYTASKKRYERHYRGVEAFDCTFEGCLLYDDAIVEEEKEVNRRELCERLDKCIEDFAKQWKSLEKPIAVRFRCEALKIKEVFMQQTPDYEYIEDTIKYFTRRLENLS